MSFKCTYRILPEHNLIISSYSGTITENEIISLKQTIKNDPAFQTDYNVLDDFSNAAFNITKESFTKVLHWLQEHFSADRNAAILTSTPNQVVNIMMFKAMEEETLPNRIKIFSTLTAALQWVDLTEEHEIPILEILQELKD